MKLKFISLLIQVYHFLLGFYPAEFLAEFGAEMEVVFSEALAEAQQKGSASVLILFLRELRDLPLSIWRERRRERRQALTLAGGIDGAGAWQPATGWETAVAILPFVLFGLLFTAQAMGYAGFTRKISLSRHVAIYLIALAGLGVGWVKGFPRWSLGYLGLVLVLSWDLAGSSTSSFASLRHTIWHNAFWGWRSLLAAALIATLFSRSLRPLIDLARSIWQDWSQLSLILYGALSWLTLLVLYDGKTWADPVASLPLSLFSSALFVVLGVLVYLRLRFPWQRALALQGAFNLAWLSSIAIGALFSGKADVAWPLLAIWFVFLLLPGLLGIVRRTGKSFGSA